MPHGVTITNPDRPIYPGGLTKGQVAEAYERLLPRLLPFVAGRAVSLLRCPRGCDARCFWQRHVPRGFDPDFDTVDSPRGAWLVIRDARSLFTAVQLGALEFHPWTVRADRPSRPDKLVIDLDPGPEVPWEATLAAARETRSRLRARNLESLAMATGGRGLHVVVQLEPVQGWAAVAGLAAGLARDMVADDPLYTTEVPKKHLRADKILLDHFRNHPGTTSIAPWSARARPGAPVARPLAWDDLDARLTLAEVREAGLPPDPWRDAPPPQRLPAPGVHR